MRKLDVFDTTLRDGEQSAGVNLHMNEKVEIALALERYGVDVMEAGFPASSRGDFNAVREIARRVKTASVAGLARAKESDIDTAWNALSVGAEPTLHIFLATSPIHMEHKLRMTPDEVIETAIASVGYAAKKFPVVEWSAEDATRSDWRFLVRIIREVIQAGAKVINLPDTVGFTTPAEYSSMLQYVREHVPELAGVKLSAHCHDDLGLAVANSLAAIEAGVDQIEGTINGIGERAGNAALEEILVALETRRDWYQIETNVDLRQTARTSKLVSTLSGMMIAPNKAVVGDNAFAHESGIHQDGVLKHASTYEVINPELVGYQTNRIVLGKHSGRHAFRERCIALGLELGDESFQKLFESFKQLTEKKKEVSDDDIFALLLDGSVADFQRDELEFFHISHSLQETNVAIGIRTQDGTVRREASTGGGSVEAIYNTIQRFATTPFRLEDYRIQSATEGPDALAEVYVKVEIAGILITGRGVDSDVLIASAKAFLDSVNRSRVRTMLEEQRPLPVGV